jgi:hypothetical protein
MVEARPEVNPGSACLQALCGLDHFKSIQDVLSDGAITAMRQVLAATDFTSATMPAAAVDTMLASAEQYDETDPMSLLFTETYLAATRYERLRAQIASLVAEVPHPLERLARDPSGSRAGLTESIIDDSGPLPKTLGWEIRENSIMDGTITGGAAADYLILSGDFKAGYQIVDRLGSSLEVAQNLFGAAFRPTDQRGFLMLWRTGGDVVIPDAFRLTNYSA